MSDEEEGFEDDFVVCVVVLRGNFMVSNPRGFRLTIDGVLGCVSHAAGLGFILPALPKPAQSNHLILNAQDFLCEVGRAKFLREFSVEQDFEDDL